ncbi:hypothetical protein HDU98_011013 [Podochytrium sp. JEL0797]|nr:hypothetical protein HDU98_011013 [Podochytrium sp. JEL0797]
MFIATIAAFAALASAVVINSPSEGDKFTQGQSGSATYFCPETTATSIIVSQANTMASDFELFSINSPFKCPIKVTFTPPTAGETFTLEFVETFADGSKLTTDLSLESVAAKNNRPPLAQPILLPPVEWRGEVPASFAAFEVQSTGPLPFELRVASSPSAESVQVSFRLESSNKALLNQTKFAAKLTPQNVFLIDMSFPKDNREDALFSAHVNVTFPTGFALDSFYADAEWAGIHWTDSAPQIQSGFDAALKAGNIQIEPQLLCNVVGVNIERHGKFSAVDLVVSESIVVAMRSGLVSGKMSGFKSLAAKVEKGSIDVDVAGVATGVEYLMEVVVGTVKAHVNGFRGLYDVDGSEGVVVRVVGGDPGSTQNHGTVGGADGKSGFFAKAEVGSIDLVFDAF